MCLCAFLYSHIHFKCALTCSCIAEVPPTPKPQSSLYKSTLNSLNGPSLLAELYNAIHMFSSEPSSTALHCIACQHTIPTITSWWRYSAWTFGDYEMEHAESSPVKTLCTCWLDIQQHSLLLIIHAPQPSPTQPSQAPPPP